MTEGVSVRNDWYFLREADSVTLTVQEYGLPEKFLADIPLHGNRIEKDIAILHFIR
ncbi:hypothetical protein [Parablautia intestinalis]|uniref:hypothetical protein n=1 Tax=Parablautia intestinalis TaxID=2320100 RepID=UPI002412910A|nr:hypothetical protein [Parablautia intestinalis]MCI8616579.1 hypothetical protein [Lachnospiraceae bacterium]